MNQREQATSGSATTNLPTQSLAITAPLAAVAASVGGYAVGVAIEQFGYLGAVAVWPLGALVGLVGAKSLVRHKIIGGILAGAVCCAFLVGETWWIHWNIVGAETWFKAASLLPQFFKENQVSALSGGIFTFFGAASAYRQTAHRVRYVAVVDP